MQLSFDVQIPDGLLAANALLAENSRQGFGTYSGTLHQGFGVAISSTPLGIPGTLYDGRVRCRYTGKERDAESGLDYFGARYYASGAGRWMSADWSAKAEPVPYSSLDNPQSLNLYSYVKNNPLSHVDIDGHGELWDKFKAIFYAKATVGVGAGAEVKLTKYLTAGAHVSAGLEHKQTSEGSTTSAKVEGKAGITVGKADLSLKPSAEMQILKDGHLDVQKPELKLGLPSLGGDAGAAKLEAAPNEIGVSGHYEAFGGEVGIDVGKVQEFGQAVGQSLSDLGAYIKDKVTPDPSGPQNIPSPVPRSPF